MTKAKVVEKNNVSQSFIGSDKKKFSLVFSRKQLCIPYALFLTLFVVFPLIIIVYYAFTAKTGGFSLENFVWFFSNPTSVLNLLRSLGYGLITTLICLLIGYPVAFILSKIKSQRRTILLLLFIMPMWINFVLRAMAMKELLGLLGIYGKYNELSVIIGMVYDYLPFMILPLYTTLIKMDKSLEEAAADLGANKFKTFTKITLPLSLSGIISGITMVFLPTMTCYVVSDTFGSGKVTIIGKLIERWFGSGSNWHYGSVVALILLLFMFIGTAFSGGLSKSGTERGTDL